MGEVYFIRHGQASFGAANYDKLSDLGHKQAEWLGAHLAETVGGFDQIISGNLRRHQETLAGILKSVNHGDCQEDDRLNEMPYFDMERSYCAKTGEKMPSNVYDMERHFTRVMQAWEADEIPTPPERYDHFRDRIVDAFQAAAQPEKRVLLVSSGGPIAVLMRHVLGLEMAAMSEIIIGTANASITRFSVRNDRLRLVQFNAVPHLEHPERKHALTFL